MHAIRPRLERHNFPQLYRRALETLQVNLGYLCNMSCLHCHVNAGPKRKEVMDRATIDKVLEFMQAAKPKTLDLTGGAPEMNPHFKELIYQAKQLDIHTIDRCNLTILEEPDHQDLAEFLAEKNIEIIASLPCYLEENVDQQRGNGAFQKSITALKKLNDLGYGEEQSGLTLNLVYNPQGPTLPPPQNELETAYKKHLKDGFGIVFNQLFTMVNMPIQRFGSTLVSNGQFENYMELLKENYNPDALGSVMCKSTLSIDWQGYVYDCDFNQMLNLPLADRSDSPIHVSELNHSTLVNQSIAVRQHCYGCTAGQGSSCGGAISENPITLEKSIITEEVIK
ncbi:MAG: arsenosugar biosynthesis radical SAM (seleno)protein ArsS [Methylococcales bacterium]